MPSCVVASNPRAQSLFSKIASLLEDHWLLRVLLPLPRRCFWEERPLVLSQSDGPIWQSVIIAFVGTPATIASYTFILISGEYVFPLSLVSSTPLSSSSTRPWRVSLSSWRVSLSSWRVSLSSWSWMITFHQFPLQFCLSSFSTSLCRKHRFLHHVISPKAFVFLLHSWKGILRVINVLPSNWTV